MYIALRGILFLLARANRKMADREFSKSPLESGRHNRKIVSIASDLIRQIHAEQFGDKLVAIREALEDRDGSKSIIRLANILKELYLEEVLNKINAQSLDDASLRRDDLYHCAQRIKCVVLPQIFSTRLLTTEGYQSLLYVKLLAYIVANIQYNDGAVAVIEMQIGETFEAKVINCLISRMGTYIL